MSFHYIIAGDHDMAVAVKSDWTWDVMYDYVRNQSQLIHPKRRDRIFRMGLIEIINPKVMLPNDFATRTPYLIGIK